MYVYSKTHFACVYLANANLVSHRCSCYCCIAHITLLIIGVNEEKKKTKMQLAITYIDMDRTRYYSGALSAF